MVGLGNIDNFIGNLFLFSLFLFSHLASVGLVRTKGHALHNTKRIVTYAFAQKDTQGNTVNWVRKYKL